MTPRPPESGSNTSDEPSTGSAPEGHEVVRESSSLSDQHSYRTAEAVIREGDPESTQLSGAQPRQGSTLDAASAEPTAFDSAGESLAGSRAEHAEPKSPAAPESQVAPKGHTTASAEPTSATPPSSIRPTRHMSVPPRRPASARNAVIVGPGGSLRHPLQSLRDILFKDPTQSVPIARPEDKIDRILTMMRRLGTAMLKSHHATPDVKETLKQIAVAYNMPPVRVVSLPTVIAIQVEGTDRRAEIGSVEGGNFRLDQAAMVDEIVSKARRGVIEPDEALSAIERIVRMKPRFNWFLHLVGQVIMTVAIGLLINPAWPAIPAYVILGLIVGVLQLLGDRVSTLSIAMPVLCAMVVTVVASAFLSGLTHEVPVRLIAPALVTFLPGGTLTIAALELTRDEVIAGSSRLIYGISQLLLLAFGVVIGLAMVPDSSTSNEVVLNSMGPWTPLLGIALLALGYVLSRSAPQGSYMWLVLALAITYGAQRLGGLVVPPEFSGFFGALLVVPLSRFLAKFRTAPSATVTQLVSFWILVPGSLGFISFTEAASGASQTLNTLVTTGMTLFSIALGIIVGSGLHRDTSRLRRSETAL